MTGHEEAKSHPSCILNGFDTLRRQLTSAGSTPSRTAPSFARPLAIRLFGIHGWIVLRSAQLGLPA